MKNVLAGMAAALFLSCSTSPVSSPPPTTVPDAIPQAAGSSGDGFRPWSGGRVPSPAEPLVSVGLLTDEGSATFPRTSTGYYVISDAGTFFTPRGFVAHAPLAGQPVRYGVQVGAISDSGSAEGMKRQIEERLRADVVIVFDAATGMNRVIAGNFASADEARPFRETLINAGWPSESMIVPRPSGQTFTPAVRVVDDEGLERTFSGGRIDVIPAGDEIQIAGAPYRGIARLHVNSRGLFNVINRLNLDDYVKGVIPSEMGPRIYDELEAQKAQALAARTYAVRRLGDYRSEGYDICPTPACQVYKGKGTEQELSNRAVDETAGLVITYEGKPIDALFSATCGGATSDVDVMFPGRTDPYLRHASCVESELLSFDGRADGPLLDTVSQRARLFQAVTGFDGARTSWSAGDVAAVVDAAMRHAGLESVASGRPASSRRGDVYRWLHELWNISDSARLLLLPEDVRYYFPSQNADAPEIRTAAWLIKFEFLPFQMIDQLDMNAAMPRDELMSILYSWLLHLKTAEEIRGRIRDIDGRMMLLKADWGNPRLEVPQGTPVFRQLGDRIQELRTVPVIIGDRAAAVRTGGRVVALTIEANYDGAAFDRTSAYSSWVRSWREEELVKAISRRNPIRDLEDLRIVSRDEAGRIRELQVVADSGRTISLRGLPIRWSLDTPDNLFTIQRSMDRDGVSRWTFFGKGWGHGTGMCQVGAFGMAFRGHTAAQIIHNYYHGVEIQPLR